MKKKEGIVNLEIELQSLQCFVFVFESLVSEREERERREEREGERKVGTV